MRQGEYNAYFHQFKTGLVSPLAAKSCILICVCVCVYVHMHVPMCTRIIWMRFIIRIEIKDGLKKKKPGPQETQRKYNNE